MLVVLPRRPSIPFSVSGNMALAYAAYFPLRDALSAAHATDCARATNDGLSLLQVFPPFPLNVALDDLIFLNFVHALFSTSRQGADYPMPGPPS